MSGKKSPVAGEGIRVASGRLRWVQDGEDLVTGEYRIRLLGPEQWETTLRGRPIHVDRRRSMALAYAEHHFREAQRRKQITWWASSAGVSLLGAIVLYRWISTPLGFVSFAALVGVFLGSLARCVAAITRSLLDPYRIRESWEPPDWWNRPVFR